MCIGVLCDLRNIICIYEGEGKPTQKGTLEAFRDHIKSGSVLVHDEEKAHKKLIKERDLKRYLEEHRPEVEKIMMTMFSPEYVKMASERTEKIKEDISAYRFAEMPDVKIKDLIIRRYNLTPTYAQNFLDDDSDPDDSRPWAL